MSKEKIPLSMENQEIKSPYEKVAKSGNELIIKESESDIPPRRAGGFILSTVVAMGLAMGAMGGKAEAQVRGIGPQGESFGGRLAGEVLNRGVFEAGSAIDKNINEKRVQVEQSYVAELSRLERLENQTQQEYQNKIREAETDSQRNLLENQYRLELEKINKDKINLKREYEKKIRNLKIKQGVVGSIFGGVRGW